MLVGYILDFQTMDNIEKLINKNILTARSHLAVGFGHPP